MTSVLLPSRRPLMTSSLRCGHTVELVASVLAAATNGLQAIALQEEWDLCAETFQETDVADTPDPEPPTQEQVFMLLSATAVTGSASPRTMQLKGSLSGQDILILVDSGSSHSFLSTSFAADMPSLKKLSSPMTVRVADGGSIVCSAEL